MTSVEMVPSSAARAPLRAQEQARAGHPRSRAEGGRVSGFWEGQACTLNTQLGVRGGLAPSLCPAYVATQTPRLLLKQQGMTSARVCMKPQHAHQDRKQEST